MRGQVTRPYKAVLYILSLGFKVRDGKIKDFELKGSSLGI